MVGLASGSKVIDDFLWDLRGPCKNNLLFQKAPPVAQFSASIQLPYSKGWQLSASKTITPFKRLEASAFQLPNTARRHKVALGLSFSMVQTGLAFTVK